MSSGNPAPFAPAERRQLFRFCLYGFLKNQQYYEWFIILAFRDKGLSFTAIAGLFAFSRVCINLLEIPTGAVADAWGRRRTMIASFSAYIVAFLALAFAPGYWALFPAMMFYSAGEAFREGTHKAMIFDWLTRLGRAGEKTRIYGVTRSWSKIGSALSIVVAAAIVVATRDYRWVFVLSTVPFAANIVNFLCYPKYLDGDCEVRRLPGEAAARLWSGVKLVGTRPALRGLIVESMCFEGIFEAAKDFIQPLVKAVAAVALLAWLPEMKSFDEMIRTAFLMVIVVVPLSLAASLASRQSHRAASSCGGEDRLASWLWVVALALYLGTGAALLAGVGALAILGFVLLTSVQNVWRPTLTARYYCHAETGSAATTLSVESQARGLAAAAILPVLGVAVDRLSGGAKPVPAESLWPVAAAGVLFCLLGLLINLRMRSRAVAVAGAEATTDGSGGNRSTEA